MAERDLFAMIAMSFNNENFTSFSSSCIEQSQHYSSHCTMHDHAKSCIKWHLINADRWWMIAEALSLSVQFVWKLSSSREWSRIQHKSTSIGEPHRESAWWMEKIIRIFRCSLFIYIYDWWIALELALVSLFACPFCILNQQQKQCRLDGCDFHCCCVYLARIHIVTRGHLLSRVRWHFRWNSIFRCWYIKRTSNALSNRYLFA